LYRAAQVNPALANKIGGSGKIYDMFYLWGFSSAFVIYVVLSKIFPAEETLIPATIHEDDSVIDGSGYASTPVGEKTDDLETGGSEKGKTLNPAVEAF
jgi:NCS1 family nucleobase:cation symporter-1